MPGPHPATAVIRSAVRAEFAALSPGDVALVGLSGGADSMALAAAAGFVGPRSGVLVGAVVVDHGLQVGSAAVAARAAAQARSLGLDPVETVAVDVHRGSGGLEAAAREARYGALDMVAAQIAGQSGAAAQCVVLLGHTLDDQAEQVLLGLARGSGARSLAGMPSARGRFRRPLLAVTRAQTRASCRAEGLRWWADPMNDDPAFQRVRARRAIEDLERDLGPGVAAALARSADQLRADADLLDDLADQALAALSGAVPDETGVEVGVKELSALPRAVRTRVWRRLVIGAGSPAGQVSSRHVDACDALLTQWRGQGPVHLPGDLRVGRLGRVISISAADLDR